jgi:pimeloyl-ACP methyl ester carboxylesterase
VATDYAGLGNNFTSHKYSSYAAHANDLYYSVQAAHKAFPAVFTKEWMSVGHSQGGGAVWKLSEHPLVQNRSSGYLGTVAVSPAPKLYDSAKYVFDSTFSLPDFHQFVVVAEIGPLVRGIERVFLNYTAPWLGDGIRRRLGLANLAQSCTLAFMGLSFDLTREQLIAPDANPAADETLKQFQLINAPAQGDRASRPLLVIQGLNDTSVLPEITAPAYRDAIAAGNEVSLLWYPGLDHSATITASAPMWLKFLDDQFAHKGDGALGNITVEPLDLAVAKAPLELPLNEEPLLGFLRY